MRDILDTVRAWRQHDDAVGLATVVDVRRSAPRQPGAAMAVSAAGEVIGSVSGGCVEGAVFDVAQQVMASHQPQLVTYGISDDEAMAVGLTCGGEIELFIERLDSRSRAQIDAVADAIAAEAPLALATVIAGPADIAAKLAVTETDVVGTLGDEGLDAAVGDDARGMLEQGATAQRRYGRHGERRRDEVTVFIESFAPRPRMYVFGAIDFAAAVARIGSYLGYHVTVCDARAVFATRKRFPEADDVVVEWPHRFLASAPVDRRTTICVLTHDPKFDVPVLEIALRSDASYVGAMGSRRTHEDRMQRLREQGLTDRELARLHSPIGLDLGARTPEETAVSIAAEIIQSRWGGPGLPLRATSGAIHRHADRVRSAGGVLSA
ncbi:MAG: XdhC family protein [Nitriliruptoraceae bacterium]